MTDSTGVLEPIGGKSATLYLAAGTLLAVFAANTGARTFADAGVPVVHSVVGPAGFLVGFLGLYGLYPALADRSPRVARVAAVAATVPLAGWFAIVVAGAGSAAGMIPGASVVLPGAVFVAVFPLTVLAYVLFAAASLRADVHSPTVGVLLLAPAATFLGLMVGVAALPPAESLEFVVDAGHSLGHLAIGAALRVDGVRTAHPEPAPDSTA